MPQLKSASQDALARSHAPWRLSNLAGVKARIAQLTTRHATLCEADIEETILALLELAARTDLRTAAGAKEARASRLEAHRLSGLLAARREAETWTPPREMTEAEWTAKYGPDAPGSAYHANP